MPVCWRAPRNHENARSALECGGLTPPWDRHGPLSTYTQRKGGVKPPHSKAPSAQAFSGQTLEGTALYWGGKVGRLIGAPVGVYFPLGCGAAPDQERSQ